MATYGVTRTQRVKYSVKDPWGKPSRETTTTNRKLQTLPAWFYAPARYTTENVLARKWRFFYPKMGIRDWEFRVYVGIYVWPVHVTWQTCRQTDRQLSGINTPFRSYLRWWGDVLCSTLRRWNEDMTTLMTIDEEDTPTTMNNKTVAVVGFDGWYTCAWKRRRKR